MGNWIRFRLGFVYVGFVAFFALVSLRLLQLQVWPNPDLEDLAKRQFTHVGRKSPYRMPVYDRNGEELAISLPSSSVFIRPKLVRSRKRVAQGLAKVFGGSAAKWTQKIDTKKNFVWIERQVSEELAQKLQDLRLPGVFIEPENRRIYPNGTLAASVLGFTDVDGNGISGLEHTLDKELLSGGEKTRTSRDGKGNTSYIDKQVAIEEKKPAVYLTLDRRIQNVVEEEVSQAMEESRAKSVMAIVMDPHTGEIFALGQTPGFDPNQAKEYASDTFTNRMVSYLYEPGSTMKPLLAAEAIESGVMTKNTLVDCNGGKLRVGDRTITEADAKHHWKKISVEEVVRYSSNVGAVKIAQSLGTERVKAILDKYGLNAKTQIPLPGEAVSPLKADAKWRPIHLATAGFGHGFSTTPLQMALAYAPFANGGYMVKPKILLRDSDDRDSSRVRKVLSEKTVETMKAILVSVTEGKGGTATPARVPGMRVAGKTGTAQKYEAGVGYNSKKYYSSFIGFLPADKPELLVAVMVDEPRKGYYGTEVAAPVFRRIAERSIKILDRVPKSIAAVSQTPFVEQPAMVPTLDRSEDGKTVMPDLKGVSMRDAVRLLSKYSDNLKISGDGYLLSQSPSPGATIDEDVAISLNFNLPN